MDDNIVVLASRRRPPPAPAPVKRELPASDRFFCLACESDRFVLFGTGHIHCGDCHVHVQNLVVRVL